MRNHLAEEVLNKDMLNLMLEYKTSLAHQGEVLNGVIELLRNTSKMIEVFIVRDPSAKRMMKD